MSDPTEYVAVVDRFEGDEAVLLLERDAGLVGDLVVPREDLPPDARTQDAVLLVAIDDGVLVDLRYDPEATDRRAERAQSRFDRLAERPPDGTTTDTDDAGRDPRDDHGDHDDHSEQDGHDASDSDERDGG